MTEEKAQPRGEGPVQWVSTDWLETHLSDRGLHVLDCQPDVHDYIQEHLPGAVYLNPDLFLVAERGIPNMFVPERVAQEILRSAGLKADEPVAVYSGRGAVKGWGDGLEQALVAYALARFGHERVLLVDGGLEKWKLENRKLVRDFPVYKRSRFKARANEELFIDYDDFRRVKDREDIVIFDARPPDLYEGQGPWLKGGHIPGALSLPWTSLVTEHNPRLLRPENELRELAYRHQLTPGKTLLCSSGTGREATLPFLVLRFYLGFPKVRLYEGSFTEWSAYPDNPTVTGPSPR